MKEELRDFYIKKGQTMTREEMMKYIFGNSTLDKLNDREKELMSNDEQKIFNTAYEEGCEDGYRNGIILTMKWFESLLIHVIKLDEKFVKNAIIEWAEEELLTNAESKSNQLD